MFPGRFWIDSKSSGGVSRHCNICSLDCNCRIWDRISGVILTLPLMELTGSGKVKPTVSPMVLMQTSVANFPFELLFCQLFESWLVSCGTAFTFPCAVAL